MRSKNIIMLCIFSLVLMLVLTCEKKEEHQTGEITKEEQTGDDSNDSFVGTIKPKPINYDSMLTIISPLVDSIKNKPENVELRKQLVDVSYDTTWETILAAGIGKPMEHAATESVGMKYAEQAAAADAYRWAIYIKKWTTDPTFPDIGKVNAEIQGRIVAKQIQADKSVSVLIEVQASKLP